MACSGLKFDELRPATRRAISRPKINDPPDILPRAGELECASACT
jgi:hypothetical protein